MSIDQIPAGLNQSEDTQSVDFDVILSENEVNLQSQSLKGYAKFSFEMTGFVNLLQPLWKSVLPSGLAWPCWPVSCRSPVLDSPSALLREDRARESRTSSFILFHPSHKHTVSTLLCWPVATGASTKGIWPNDSHDSGNATLINPGIAGFVVKSISQTVKETSSFLLATS